MQAKVRTFCLTPEGRPAFVDEDGDLRLLFLDKKRRAWQRIARKAVGWYPDRAQVDDARFSDNGEAAFNGLLDAWEATRDA